MRRIALGAVVAALLVAAAVALGARRPAAAPAPTTLKWTAGPESGISEREHQQDLLAYWGTLSPQLNETGTPSATYRARCLWLRPADNDRIACTIIVSVTDTGSIVLEGMLSRPKNGKLFAEDHADIKLPITGATGQYNPNRGWADVNPAGAPGAAVNVTVK